MTSLRADSVILEKSVSHMDYLFAEPSEMKEKAKANDKIT